VRGVDFITLFTCVDVPYAAPQEAGPSQQSDQIACGRDVSGFVIVSVALAHPNRHPVPALVVHASACALSNLMLSRRDLDLNNNPLMVLDFDFDTSISYQMT
jgi:hypothetical protein